MENNKMEKEKSLPFLQIMRKNALLICMITILITLLGVLYGILYVKPVYTVKRSVILRTELTDTTSEATNASLASLYLVQMPQHFTSTKFIELANEEYALINPDWKKDPIKSSEIVINYNSESLIFSIGYIGLNKDKTIDKLNAVCKVATDENGFFNQLSDFKITLIPTDNSTYDLSKLDISVNNGLSKCVIFGFLIGLIVGVAVAFIRHSLDNTIQDKDELEELTGAGVLAYISNMK